MENLLEDLIGLGVVGPLSKYGGDLSNVAEITSNCQAKRGNRAFMDPVTNRMYITYANGYVRRYSKWTHDGGWPTKTMYPINKRVRDKDGSKGCVLVSDPEERMQMMIKAIRKFRTN
jgi:hypothetical protein